MKTLSDYALNVFSQFGEDGIVQKIFEILKTSSKICIEFGAWDGFYLSNTANLWTRGWKGILIESDKERYGTLVESVKKYNCRCINAKVTHEGNNTLERILQREALLNDVDLLSIDVDGDDYYILESLREIKPRLIICEYNPTIPMHLDLVAEPGNYFGCSALTLIRLAEAKGYKLVAMTDTNCFFVQEKDFHSFSEYETSLQFLGTTKHLTYLITGYAGDYVASRMPIYGCTGATKQKLRGEYYSFPAETKRLLS